MHETGVKLLNLMFRPGETICVSPNKFGYHSTTLESAMSGVVALCPKDPERSNENVLSNDLLLVALNPIQGWREDKNCTAFRNFLVELDDGTTTEQLNYIKKIGMPYSAAVFSGNKSLHFLISLDKDLPNEKAYRKISRWVLGVATLADQKTINPSRSIRIPGAEREPGKFQQLVEFRGKVTVAELRKWLAKYPSAEPKPKPKREPSAKGNMDRIKPWAMSSLVRIKNGERPKNGRNAEWFAIACEFAIAGYSEDEAVNALSQYYSEEHDFKEREWLSAIRSGFKHIHEGKSGG